MEPFKLQIPPGQFGNGTEYQTGPRWREGNLVRTNGGRVMPMGGWLEFATGLSGKGRAAISYTLNDGTPRIVVGTQTHLWHIAGNGTATDITPSGYTAGDADASMGGGYGAGAYGAGLYGTPRPDDGTTQPATVWTLDVRGQTLIACNNEDGKIYTWDGDTANNAVALTGGAPTARGIVVSAEAFVFALGAAGNPRQVAWSDQLDIEEWTGTPGVNQAGAAILETSGIILSGERVNGATLIFTDRDVHRATYNDPIILYGFQRVASDGLIGVGAKVATSESQVYWWGNQGFQFYNGGFVQQLQCAVADKVLENINLTQKSKITAFHDPKNQEVGWRYPSAASNEVDSYVIYNYAENQWFAGMLARLCDIKRGAPFNYPFAVGDDGKLYQHEIGSDRDGEPCFLETGPIELGNGGQVMNVMGIIPDDEPVGCITRTIYAAMSPNTAETTFGPYSRVTATATKIDTRLQARQIRYRIDFADGQDGRFGTDRLDIIPGGSRR